MNQPSHDIFLRHLGQTTPFPLLLEIERAEGLYVYTTDGRVYRDMISGVGVNNLGHRHPQVVEAIREQADQYLHTMVYGEFVQSAPNLLAKKLADYLPEPLESTYFTNSGAEAIEGALKLAKRYTGRSEMIAFRGGYHGSTHGALSVSGNETRKRAFRPLLPDVQFLDFNAESQLECITEQTACVLMETIQGDAGVRIPGHDFMKALRQKCTETGTLLILDEIQAGMGRTGEFFAFQHYGIVPDVVCMAKALGGGLPLGAFTASHEVMQSFTEKPMLGHITTYGGNPLSCTAGLATIRAMEEEKLMETVEAKGQLMEELLQHPSIVEIRRKGLLFAIEFSSADAVQKIVQECLNRNVICFWFLSCPGSFRIAPPLNISEKEIREACKRILAAIDAVQ